MKPGADELSEARSLWVLRRYDEAATAAQRALALAPESVEASAVLAGILIDGGRAAEGLEILHRLLAVRPDDPALERLAGVALYRLCRYEQAEQHLQRSLTLDPTSSLSHVWMVESILKRSLSLPQRTLPGSAILRQATFHAQQCARLDPDGALAPLMLAKVALAERRWNDADGHARRALAIDPEHHVGHQLLGLAAAGRGDTTAAADHLVAAGRLNPRSDSAMRQLRKLRSGLPIGALGIFIIVRIVGKATGSALGPAVALGVVAALVLGMRLWPRWNARRKMSPEARQVLQRDRQLRRSRGRRG